ncbi:unnamed protein product [Oreochromis niloticus]|nr:unnamed protein product [Mustela putorius furo]
MALCQDMAGLICHPPTRKSESKKSLWTHGLFWLKILKMDCKSFYGARQRTYLALVPENSQDSDGELSDDDPIEDPDFQPNFADDSDESCFDVSLDEDAPSTSRSNKLSRKMSKKGKTILKTVPLDEAEDTLDPSSSLVPKKDTRRIWKHEDIEEFQVPDASFETPDALQSPFQYFKMLFTDEMIDHIAYHTNLYSAQEAKVMIPCPSLIPAYNEHMGGIDLSDMLVHLYKTPAKSTRWYLPLFGYMLDLSIANSWLVYKRECGQLNQKPITLKRFRLAVAHSLKQVNKPASKVGRPSSSSPPPPKKRYTPRPSQPQPDVRYDCFGHWPLHCDKRGRCNYCPKGVSRWKCQKCNVFLCLNASQECFAVYHQKI